MYICYNISLQINDLFGPQIPISYAVLYVIPYFLGRVYLRSERDLPQALHPLTVALVALVAAIVVQAVTSVDILNLLVGAKQRVGIRRHGFYRGTGVMAHPDAAGMLLLISYPMTVAASRLARRGSVPRGGGSYRGSLPSAS